MDALMTWLRRALHLDVPPNHARPTPMLAAAAYEAIQQTQQEREALRADLARRERQTPATALREARRRRLGDG